MTCCQALLCSCYLAPALGSGLTCEDAHVRA